MADQSEKPEVFELNNGSMHVKISNFGATILSLSLPDKQGNLADVVLGFDSIEPYMIVYGLMGWHLFWVHCWVGLQIRIKEGKFALDGTKYTFDQSTSRRTVSMQKLVFCFPAGGFKGYDKVIWKVAEQKNGENPSITFKYHNRDGEEGCPRDVSVTAGHNCGNILEHTIQIGGPHITPVDENTVPTEVGLGYDHNYVLDCGEDKSGLKHAVKLKDPSSSRVLNLWTNAPGDAVLHQKLCQWKSSEWEVPFMESMLVSAYRCRDFLMP
ncbi:hypothetical protein Patl1_19599 [Pistacia atlantica]|uniref:Uncharacterized protein n=1 Tax=Pistacia atlantica TaxID=434234 RepID=A0ACC1BZK1_9ROSI|nr:hypothetical protein Patl1_19599 [Pistacia atlantica]